MAVLALLLAACTTTVRERRSQTFIVESRPSKAVVRDWDDPGAPATTPLLIEVPYAVEKTRFDTSCWYWPGLSLGLAAVGGALALPALTGNASGYEALGALLGAATFGALGGASAIVGTTYCAVARATAGERVHPARVELDLRHPGHEPARVLIAAPGPAPDPVHLRKVVSRRAP